MVEKETSPLPWYQEGLRFKCTQCGKCCTGSPGFVWITQEDIQEMARFLAISPQEFIELYTRRAHGRLALLEKSISYDCIFLKNKKECQLYGSRPKQCRQFPWWPGNLESKKNWEEAARECEGINHPEAPLISFKKIEEERCS